MKILVIASAEWLNKTFLLLTALLVGLGIVVVPLFLSQSAVSARENQLAAAVTIGFPLTALLGLLFGAGMLAPDIQEGRLGFYLAQPVRPAALFVGKALGVTLLTFAIGLLVMLPTALLNLGADNGWLAIVPLAALALTTPLAGHALSIALRARTPWLLLDLAGLVAIVLALVWVLRWMVVLGALGTFGRFLIGLFVLSVGALGMAGWAQVSKGRTDLKLGHRWLSMVWILVPLMVVSGVMVVKHRKLNVDLDSIKHLSVKSALRQGPWILAASQAEGDDTQSFDFLLNTETGKGVRVGPAQIVFSDNGQRAIWEQPATALNLAMDWEVWTLDLGARNFALRPTGIRIPQAFHLKALDAEGHQLAILDEQVLSVYNLDNGVLVARHKLEVALFYWSRLIFLDAYHVRVYSGKRQDSGGTYSIYDLDIRRGRLASGGTLRLEGHEVVLGRGPRQDALLVRGGSIGARRLELRDAATGAVKKILVPEGRVSAIDAAFLWDGSIVITEQSGAGHRFRHLDAEGNDLGSMPLPGPSGAPQTHPRPYQVLEESPRGKVTLWLPEKVGKGGYHLVILDLKSGECLPADSNLCNWGDVEARSGFGIPLEPGAPRVKLESAADRSVVILKPDGSQRKLADGQSFGP